MQPYTLPVPFAMYAFGASAALVLSFVVVGVFATVPSVTRAAVHAPAANTAPQRRAAGWGVRVGRSISVALLALCIATGLLGTRDAFANFNMTFFWIVFVLGVPYAVVLIGDFYAAVNPWKALVLSIERLGLLPFNGRVRYPEWLAYYPALALYMTFIWLELFGGLRPRGLSIALLGYTVVNLAGAWLFGTQAWFRHGEFFGVMMRLLGKMSPWTRSWDPDDMATHVKRWRPPFVGLLEERADHASLVLLILFMLSSTAFDGIHSTVPWVSFFWKEIFLQLLPWLPPNPRQQHLISLQLYYGWQWGSLFLSPLIYFLVFVAFVWLAKAVTRTSQPLRVLVLRFAVSLVPIGFVYHLTHYYTLLLAQGGQILRLVSDPFGYGWNLLGTARLSIMPLMVDVDIIWHTQVALILIGHIVSVYLAHVEALQLFSTPRRAAASQLPMLALMMLFTTLGLWILSLPLVSG